MNKLEIKYFLNNYLKSIEGESAGGSGHLSSVSYILEDFSFINMENGLIEIIFSYKKIVETEFTYYPDNPPCEYLMKKRIVIDEKKQIVVEDL